MLLTVSTTHQPATDLGFLLHKHPDRVQAETLSFGRAHTFYPEASVERCTAALLLDIDPIALARGSRRAKSSGPTLYDYVNDRPYVASSFLSVALARSWRTAMAGKSADRPELAATRIPLEIRVSALPCRGGEQFLRRLFEPLGYEVSSSGHPLDETFPDWGESRYRSIELRATKRLSEALSHLYVLIPVLDDQKHYWVSEAEVDKLLSKGEGWLEAHPERNIITRRYLRYRPSLAREALSRLLQDEESENEPSVPREEESLEKPISLAEQRLGAVLAAVRNCGAGSVLDLGCGEGKLLKNLLREKQLRRIAGLDVSIRALEIAASRLKLDRLPESIRKRIELLHGALTYRDKRLAGFDAAVSAEVIEHLDPPRLQAFERVLFEFARPGTAVITTPNIEYNRHFETLPEGKLRHPDHRFEWTREEFRSWGEGIAERFGYAVRFLPIGPEHPESGSPTQMALFTRMSDG